MADARPLLRIRGGIKAQSVWLCRGGRASGGGQGTHGGACVGQRCSCRGTCSASRRRLVVRWHLNTRGRSGSRSHGTLTTCSAVFRARCVGVSPVGCAYSVPCPACCVIRVRELCFRNSAKGLSRCYAAALLVPRYVVGVRGIEREGSFPVQLLATPPPSAVG